MRIFGDGDQVPSFFTEYVDKTTTTYTGDDGVTAAYGETIRDNVKDMQSGLAILKMVRTKCPMVV